MRKSDCWVLSHFRMRIFATGGTGFIGSYFVKVALEAGHDVVALRRPNARPPIVLESEPVWIERELRDVNCADIEGCDALVHFAATGVSPQPTDWATAFQVNVTDSLGLVMTAMRSGVRRVVACGSCFEYGRSAARYDAIPSSAPLEPFGPYATSKAAFSVALCALARSEESSFAILRPFHVYGVGQHDSNFWPSLRAAALSGEDFLMTAGEQVRDYQSVDDVARSFLRGLDAPSPPGQALVRNLGSGRPITLGEFASAHWENWSARGSLKIGALPYRENEVMRFVPQICT